jgi:hypothetical protein
MIDQYFGCAPSMTTLREAGADDWVEARQQRPWRSGR